MKNITFFDIEIEPNKKEILDIGGIMGDGNSFHSGSSADFIKFVQGSDYLCGHNIFNQPWCQVQWFFL